MIPYGRQEVTDADIAAVEAVLRSEHLTQGPAVEHFERTVADYCGASHGITANSATSALHLACLALGVGKGDWVWTSPITFVASANCALYCGASVDFVDIDPLTCNMSTSRLEEKLEAAKASGRLPKVVIPVHLCGQPCDMEGIRVLADRYAVRIIEDASHAVGAKYKGEAVGNCRYSDITVFSFHPVKIITTGEGGMALTNNPDVANRMRLLRSHGITRDPASMTREPDGPWYYQQIALGFNYRMTDIQAALGSSQFRRVDEYVAKRQQLASRYDAMLANLPVSTSARNLDSLSAVHLYVIRLSLEDPRKSHREIFIALRERGIGVNLHYIPVHTQPYYQALGFGNGDFPEAERYYQTAISLPLFSSMSEFDQDRVVATLRAALAE
jgi:UDP-4-amino-4,6-dideoxy-N-acetyl-beta-L-altrosamine transaminase